jgi:uncharacterized protein with HEPN domain
VNPRAGLDVVEKHENRTLVVLQVASNLTGSSIELNMSRKEIKRVNNDYLKAVSRQLKILGEATKLSRMVSALAEIRTRHIPNTWHRKLVCLGF